MLANKALSAAPSAVPVYVEDVFSTYLYTGNGSTQTITNNIDLSTKGGLVWTKSRSGVSSHFLFDSTRALDFSLSSNTTGGQEEINNGNPLTLNSNGFSLPNSSDVNTNGTTYASWTFAKQAKFFDVVTYTGNGTAGKTVSHNLGSVPGCIMVKRTDTGASDWMVYHRANTAEPETDVLKLNKSDATADELVVWNDTAPTSTQFTVGTSTSVNANGGTYVAYLFAHDAGGFGASGSDNVITCGSFTTDSGGAASVTLGYEPQWLLYKTSSATGNWAIIDNMRGITTNASSNTQRLKPNLSDAEDENTGPALTATGFNMQGGPASGTVIYIAIRRGPMKTPTSGTSVFTPTVYTGTNVDNRLVDTTIAPDMVMIRQRNDTVLGGMVVGDRLRGQPYLLTRTAGAEVDDADAFDREIVSTTEYGTAFSSMSGVWVGNDPTAKLNANTTSNNHVIEAFKRAPGFFDVVCYTGTGSNTTVTHNLGVAPELIIVKKRGAAEAWAVYAGDNTDYLVLNTNAATADDNTYWNDTSPTSSVFSIGTNVSVNDSSQLYVAYLFASLTGISKVGTYTGNGSNQTINCGFTGGARLVLIKRTDSTGDWCVFDSARGIVASSDPFIQLNSTAAEITNEDAVDTDNSGFVVNETTEALNTNAATYIYLAIA